VWDRRNRRHGPALGPNKPALKIGIGIAPDIPGYRLSNQNKCLDPTFPDRLEGMIDHDINDLTILLEPGEAPEAKSIVPYGVDPARVADFDAKAGPITGVGPHTWAMAQRSATSSCALGRQV
jgi:hypothetical protein